MYIYIHTHIYIYTHTCGHTCIYLDPSHGPRRHDDMHPHGQQPAKFTYITLYVQMHIWYVSYVCLCGMRVYIHIL